MTNAVYSGAAVRRAAWQFLTGKAASALLTFVILLWLVRLLPVAEYGAYAVFIAGTDLGYALAGLGLAWLAARDLPDYRLHAGGKILAWFCIRLLLWQTAALILFVAAMAGLLDVYLAWVGLDEYRNAALLALALLLAEGLGRFLREGLMASLMLQGAARASLILRQIAFLGIIAALVYAGQANLVRVLAAEAAASLLGTLIAGAFLVRHLYALRATSGEHGWQAPPPAAQWRIALRMYGAHMVTLAYGPQVFLNLIQRALGAEAAALFGFLRTLQEQVARYLPATLLFTVLRPRLMASHLQGGVAALAREANLAGKLSLFALLPLIVLVALAGDGLVVLLSGGKFAGAGLYLLGLLLVLLPFSQRQLIETVAVATGREGTCLTGSALGLLALPLMLILLDHGLGLWAAVLAMLFGQVVFNAVVIASLAGTGYQPDWRGSTSMAISAFLAWLVGAALLRAGQSMPWLVMACGAAGAVFLAAVWHSRAFAVEERASLGRLLGWHRLKA